MRRKKKKKDCRKDCRKACRHMWLALAFIGNVFAHRFFTHLIRPSEEEERNIDTKWKEKRRTRRRGKENK